MRRRRCGVGLIVVAVLLMVLLGTACSSGGEASSTTTTTGRGLEVRPASWQLPAPVSREVLLTDGKSLVVMGGLDAKKVSTGAVYRIDPATGQSQSVGTLNPAVHDAAGARIGNEYVVVAGGSPPVRSTVQAVTLGGATRTLGQLPKPRADHVTATINATTYVFGGGDEAVALVAEVDATTDGASWRTAGTLVEAVRYPALAVVDGAAYLFGGVSTNEGTDTRSVQRYDPKTGTTQVVAQLPTPLSHASAVLLDGRVYVMGGFVNNTQVSGQILRFDPRSGQFTSVGVLPAPVTDAAAVTIGDQGYLVGGQGTDRAAVATVTIIRA